MTDDSYSLAMQLLPIEFYNTLYMVFWSTVFATLIGLPLGVILNITGKGHIKENAFVHKFLGMLVNVGRSFPFAILIVAIIPITRWIVGTSLGTTAAIVPLTIAAAPFVARLVENALNEVDKEIIEASLVIGSTPWQIVTKVLLHEPLPAIIQAITLTVINLIGYSAMAGMVGGGGLGKVAIQYGYQRFDLFIMLSTVVLMIVMVQTTQVVGNYLAGKLSKRRGMSLHE